MRNVFGESKAGMLAEKRTSRGELVRHKRIKTVYSLLSVIRRHASSEALKKDEASRKRNNYNKKKRKTKNSRQ